METLPPELVLQVAHHCSPRTLAHLTQTCRSLRELLDLCLHRKLALSPFVDEDSEFMSPSLFDVKVRTFLIWAAQHPDPVYTAIARKVFDAARVYAPLPRSKDCGDEFAYHDPDWVAELKPCLNSDGTLDVYSPSHLRRVFNAAAKAGNTDMIALLLDEITLRPLAGMKLRLDVFNTAETADDEVKGLFMPDGKVLRAAVKGGHTEAVRLLVEQARIDVAGINLTGVLQCAAKKGFVEILRILIAALSRSDAGRAVMSRLRRCTNTSISPLHVAARHGHADVVTVLLDEWGWDVLSRANWDDTPLEVALSSFRSNRQSCHVDEALDARLRRVVALLVACGGLAGWLPIIGPGGVHPNHAKLGQLHRICREGNTICLDLLLGIDAVDLSLEDRHGHRPPHCAAESGCDTIVAKLIDAGAPINPKNYAGMTPLHSAVMADSNTVCKVLHNAGADLSPRDKDRMTPLHWAARHGFVDMIEFLISAGADANSIDDHGTTPLHISIRRQNTKSTQTLLNAGVDFESADKKSGRTPLHFAAEAGNADAITLLVEAGADISATDNKGMAPLHLAAETLLINHKFDHHHGKTHKRAANACLRLIELGAPPSPRDKRGRTPLHLADWASVIDVFVHGGADTSIADNRGFAQLPFKPDEEMYAVIHRMSKAETSCVDQGGWRPVHFAAYSDDGEMYRYLLWLYLSKPGYQFWRLLKLGEIGGFGRACDIPEPDEDALEDEDKFSLERVIGRKNELILRFCELGFNPTI